MDKVQRDSLVSKARGVLAEAASEMAQNDLTEHRNKKYLANISKLTSIVEQIEDLKIQQEGKSFFKKLLTKIDGISQEDRSVDSLLAQCAIMIARLETCKQCKCISCIRDDCKFNCSVCPDMAHVEECDREIDGYCLRVCRNWYLTLKDNGTNEQYEVLCMASNKASGTHFVFLKSRTSTNRRVMKYDKMSGNVTPLSKSDEKEYIEVSNKAARILGM